MSSHPPATTRMRTSAPLGDIVLAAYDAAADICSDADQVRLLAPHVVNHMLRGSRERLVRRRSA